MRVIALDYETYYAKKTAKDPGYSIGQLGNWRYTHHEQFDPYLLSAYDGEQEWAGHPNDFNWDACEGALLIAHNAGFDSAVTRALVEQGRAPKFLLESKWQCTANMTSFCASTRSLADSVLVLGGRNLDKGMRDWMNGKTWADAVAAGKDTALKNYALSDTRECLGLWRDHSAKWPQFEQDLSSLTMKQCARGVRIDTELLDAYIGVLQESIFNLVQSFPWVQKGSAPSSPIAIAEQCRSVGIPAPPVKTHDEEGFIEWERTYGPQYSWVYGAGQWRSLGKLLSSLKTVKERLRPDDTIDFSLLYFGGHTGRWSGGGSGLNMQNLRKVPLYVKDGHLVDAPKNYKDIPAWLEAVKPYVLDVRALFIARPGKKFVMPDLSQIEPRVLAWLTGNKEFLKLVATGVNFYEAFARISMGWGGGVLKSENPELYQLAKIQILGLGYGCGWEKFITIAADYGVTLDEDQSKKLVTDYRMGNPRITGFWGRLNDEFRGSVGGDFEMELPSGRSMKYRNVRREVRSKRNAETGKYEKRFVYTSQIGADRVESYGGKLTENLVQAVSRDVFGTHLLALEEKVGDVIFHVHDEAIVEVDESTPMSEVEAAMSTCPDWIEGLPVSAEGKQGQHYRK